MQVPARFSILVIEQKPTDMKKLFALISLCSLLFKVYSQQFAASTQSERRILLDKAHNQKKVGKVILGAGALTAAIGGLMIMSGSFDDLGLNANTSSHDSKIRTGNALVLSGGAAASSVSHFGFRQQIIKRKPSKSFSNIDLPIYEFTKT